MKKKLIIFIPSIEDGGVEKNLFEVSNYLSNHKIDVEILTCNNNTSAKFSKAIKFIGTRNKFWLKKNRIIKYFVCLTILFLNLIKQKKKTISLCFSSKYLCHNHSQDFKYKNYN